MESHLNWNGISNFLIYFASGVFYFTLFIGIYVRVTPYDELALIKQGNNAAAISLSGAILGFVLPLVRAIEQASSLADLFVWALVALITQVLVYLVVRKLFSNIIEQIREGRTSEAVFLAVLSVSAGLLTAASMTE